MKVRIKLEEARKMAAMTQDELAELSGVTKANISRIERGLQEPQGATIRKLAAALRIEVKDFIVLEPGPKERE